ncbi:PAS domain S-box [Desulfovibrio ferrophilus]|uniref:PAS domain S-box n=2 Tax=Desulfovibrio ferrophilus TaxID=241368 RepID=A0A2Z6AWB5_9BACT|nr:PAS domain S-box [Desulfovibrio ferrophilus]
MELASVVSDLQFLAGVHEAEAVMTGELLKSEYQSLVLFTDKKKVYDQIRYLDITGMEVFRINYNAGNPSVVSANKLQFKGSKYYVAEGMKLLNGDIYISPFDLNMERGAIELPHKPMIRFVTPVFDNSNTRRGLVVLNFLGKRLLDVISEVSSSDVDRVMLLNEQGYWLKGLDEADEWGFMFKDRLDRTFQSRNPEAWQQISSNENGQFMSDAGLYTFDTIHLADVIVGSKGQKLEHEADSWKIVSLVPDDVFNANQRQYASRLAMVGGPGAFFLIALSMLMAHFCQKSRRAELSIIKNNASFARFVPQEFLRLVGKGSLHDVELSTSVQREVAVLFSDIRSYTTLSEGMTSEEVFSFLNDYFVFVSKPVRANEGFIDIFIGDALMALFPRSPEDALRSAVSMRYDLREFNDSRRKTGMPPVHCGYGLHFGEVTLGTLGTQERMQTTAIGDTVNLASRIESVTKTFKVEIVVSDSVYARLPDPSEFLLREIDTVRVKGKHEPVTLYECFDADPEDIAKGKVATMPLLAEAIGHYKAGEFDLALDKFTACAEACPTDSIPPIYLKRCNTMKRIPPGEGWTGVSTL